MHAIVAHLERMMQMEGLDPVLRATALQLHAHWHRVASNMVSDQASDDGPTETKQRQVWH